jgi:hypothetical protein
MHDIDDLIADDEEESSKSGAAQPPVDNSELYGTRVIESSKVEIGEVERFFDKVSVAAIHLSGGLKVGDSIEIGEGDDATRVEVSSMQIDRKDVESAGAGDSIGIKVDFPVKKGSKVYLV